MRNPATGQPAGLAPLTVPFRAGAPGVIHIAELTKRLKATNLFGADVGSGELAIQLLQFPYRQGFGEAAPGGIGDVFHVTLSMAVVRKSAGCADMVDPTLTASFAAISLSDLAPLTQRTWDPLLARDPRLLVPVDVRAIAVADGETCEHALAGSSLLSTTAPETRTPPPFSDGNPRLAGIYLHWALPDGLTQGRAAAMRPSASVAARPLAAPGSRAASRVGCAHGWWRPNAVVARYWRPGPAGHPSVLRALPPWPPQISMPQRAGIPLGQRCGTTSKTVSGFTTTSQTPATVQQVSLILSWGGTPMPASIRCTSGRPRPRLTS